ncbi:MAG TPA: hypothetical protein VMM56_07940 [Planctomycetaceae bacterium]|nr:hypothetical protein [Planctomycetaceae bacterium]
MKSRRHFLGSTIAYSISLGTLPEMLLAAQTKLTDRITRDVSTKLFDGTKCWCHPRAGIVPGAGQNGLPRVAMTMNTLDLSGSDVFKSVFTLETDDLSKTWSKRNGLFAT